MSVPLPDPNIEFEKQPENILAAMLVFGEAVGQGENARVAVLNAARNRLLYHRPEYGPRTWHGVILRPWAFSCFKMLPTKLLNPLKYEKFEDWSECYQIGIDILNGVLKDNIERCCFYFDKSMDVKPPYWTAEKYGMEHVLDVGNFHFWRYK